MTARVLEAVPNFSEGRDAAVVAAIVDAIRAAGADILDCSADPDHHRAVVTLAGPPAVVEEAVLAGARVAVERIDLRRHRGAHPRIGAVDVLPFVPLAGLDMDDARASAHRVGRRLAGELGVPVFFYAEASDPPGRTLAELRRGGFESLLPGWPDGRRPDLLPPDWPHAGAHPTAGAACVGARPVLLAWNVELGGLPLDAAAAIAAAIRETGGGFPGLRAMALDLPTRRAVQVSMNLERLDPELPIAVFRRIEELAAARGGHVTRTEVVGLVPDELVLSAAADRLRMAGARLDALLSRRLARHLMERC